MSAYYNEIDRKAAAWLRELIKQGHIADGVVDERSIEDVTPADLSEFTQCHFFAGVGVWSYALRQSGWPDECPVWTGSCPCQPFSTAGKGEGFDDERHLWPAFHWIIAQCRPVVIFGEQVGAKAGETWLDVVSTDLEGEGYAIGSAVTAACGFGAPHQRKRLYWVADSECDDGRTDVEVGSEKRRAADGGCGEDVRMADSDGRDTRRGEQRQQPSDGRFGGMADSTRGRRQQLENTAPQGARILDQTNKSKECVKQSREHNPGACDPAPTNGFWGDTDWLGCTDGKWRPVEPGTFPLADGSPERVGRLRGYGNAIVAPQAQAFIESYLELMSIEGET